MLRRLLPLLSLFAASPALALLSGFYDSAEKIEAILAAPEVAAELRQAPIGAISNTGTTPDGKDIWVLRVQDCDLTVHLTAHARDGVGKLTYSVALAGRCL